MGRKSALDKVVDDLQTDPPNVVDEEQHQFALDDQGELFGPISPPKAGRPRGAVANSTKEWAKRIVASGASPLEFWARVILREPAQMAAEWGLSMPEVLDRKMEAAKLLAPHVHKRMPIAIDVGGELRHLLVMGDISNDPANDDAMAGVINVNEKGVDNQALTIEHLTQSDGEKSDD